MGRVVRGAGIAMLLLAAVAVLWSVVNAVRSPRGVCEERLPWFEGLVVIEAEGSWPPPLVRCVAEDRDPPQYGERSDYTAWGTGAVVGAGVFLVADLLAVVGIVSLTRPRT